MPAAPLPPRGAGRLVGGALRRRAADTAVGTLLVVVHLLAELLVPVVIGLVVDRAVARRDLASLLAWCAVLALLFVVLAGAAYGGYQRARAAAERIALDLRVRLTGDLLAPVGPAAPPGSGELLSLATSDARRVGAVAELVAVGASAVAALGAGAVVLLRTSVPLGLLVLGGVPVVVLVVRLLSGPLERRSGAEQAAVAGATAVASDLLRGLRVLKGLRAEEAAADRYRAASRAALSGRVRAAGLQAGTESLLLAVNAVLLAAVAWAGARLVLRGELTVGELVAAVGLAQFLVTPVQRLAFAVGQLAVVTASARRLAAVLDAPREVPDTGTTVAGGPGALSLRGVRDGDLLLDLDLPAGSWTGLVAPPGEAQLVVDLLARRRDPAAGTVLLDGVPYPELAVAGLRAAVLVADHDAVLLGDRIGDDLVVGRPPDPAVLAACAADEVLVAVPGGLDAHPGEDGRALSGGQRQRLVLARAVMADPSVLVLHDPTTAVDSATEAAVARGLRTVRPARTTVLLTGSPALLAACDAVVLLRDGRVARTGPHRDLLEDAAYRAAVLG